MAGLLFRKPAAKIAADVPRTAIIDIGSNSIRLVVYQGHERLPAILFNEKVMAGLGRGLAATGSIEPSALATARTALARFAAVAREMEASVRTVATAAVRDAANGEELIDAARQIGLDVEILSGEQEAKAAGEGVLSAIPDADGIVGDLGGGSLELVRIRASRVEDRVSFPLGVLRIAGPRAKRGQVLERLVARLVREAGWAGRGEGLPLYLVGGSWRALARLDMTQSGYPLPVIHQYAMTPETIAQLGRSIAHLTKPRLKAVSGISSGRAGTLGDATALLGVLLRQLGSTHTIVSAFGLREGLLFGALDAEDRALDPLIVAARQEGQRFGRFPEHGDLLDGWIAPLFIQDSVDLTRLRHAACLLADVGWHANPEFRAERGLDVALHGNWVAIDARGRALIAQALFSSLGGGNDIPVPLKQLATENDLRHAISWGLAIRLGQRLSGGVRGPLKSTAVYRERGKLILTFHPGHAALYGEAVERRHKILANDLGLEISVEELY